MDGQAGSWPLWRIREQQHGVCQTVQATEPRELVAHGRQRRQRGAGSRPFCQHAPLVISCHHSGRYNSKNLTIGIELKNQLDLSVLLTVLFGKTALMTLCSAIPVSGMYDQVGRSLASRQSSSQRRSRRCLQLPGKHLTHGLESRGMGNSATFRDVGELGSTRRPIARPSQYPSAYVTGPWSRAANEQAQGVDLTAIPIHVTQYKRAAAHLLQQEGHIGWEILAKMLRAAPASMAHRPGLMP